MVHTSLDNMLDEMLANPGEIFVSSNSKQCALYSTRDGAFFFLEGDFSGSQAEIEAEVRRIMRNNDSTKVVIAA